MNILFLTISNIDDICLQSIYTDLMRYFKDKGHRIYIVCPQERRLGRPTQKMEQSGINILKVRIGNITKTNLIEKGISTLTIQGVFRRAIQKFYGDVRFNLVLYSTPPITFSGLINYIKRKHHAVSYLLLKDIFPQNAVDLGMLTKRGIRGIIYRYFRFQERKLYKISDYIGCMSEANVEYVLQNNDVDRNKVEVCPNSILPVEKYDKPESNTAVRRKYGIPEDKTVFLYGGNLGRPQGVGYIIQCLQAAEQMEDVFFCIIGQGTEYKSLESYFQLSGGRNFCLIPQLPANEYESMVGACDVGLIFLDYSFTIPNFPSRILSYMQAKLPILLATDPATDISKVAEQNGFGYSVYSNDVQAFCAAVKKMAGNKASLLEMGRKARAFLEENYTAEQSYRVIMHHFIEGE